MEILEIWPVVSHWELQMAKCFESLSLILCQTGGELFDNLAQGFIVKSLVASPLGKVAFDELFSIHQIQWWEWEIISSDKILKLVILGK